MVLLMVSSTRTQPILLVALSVQSNFSAFSGSLDYFHLSYDPEKAKNSGRYLTCFAFVNTALFY